MSFSHTALTFASTPGDFMLGHLGLTQFPMTKVRCQSVDMRLDGKPDPTLLHHLTCISWLAGQGSNLEPPDPKSGVLPIELPATAVLQRRTNGARA